MRAEFSEDFRKAVKKSFLIIFLYCHACRRKGDDKVVLCSDCGECEDGLIRFVLFGPHDKTYSTRPKSF